MSLADKIDPKEGFGATIKSIGGKELHSIHGTRKEVIDSLKKVFKELKSHYIKVRWYAHPYLSDKASINFERACNKTCLQEMTPKCAEKKNEYETILEDMKENPEEFSKNKNDLKIFKSVLRGQIEKLDRILETFPAKYLK